MVYQNYQNQSQVTSTKRKPAETGACVTVLSGSSNNETIDEINQSSYAVAPAKIKEKHAAKSGNKKSALANFYDIKSAEATRRSQSGDGSKSLNTRDKHKNNNSKEQSNIIHQTAITTGH